MATYSSILVWRIPWTEEPHGLQSLGHSCTFFTVSETSIIYYLCKVRHDWATNTPLFPLWNERLPQSVTYYMAISAKMNQWMPSMRERVKAGNWTGVSSGFSSLMSYLCLTHVFTLGKLTTHLWKIWAVVSIFISIPIPASPRKDNSIV